MLCLWRQVAVFLLLFVKCCQAVEIPFVVEQLPTIIEATQGVQVAFPVGEDFTLKCEAKGNPAPDYHWTKDGAQYNPFTDQNVKAMDDSGTFTIHNDGRISAYNGTYRCYASNKLGTAISEETSFIVPGDPIFPKEDIPPVELEEGDPLVLTCEPPSGINPVSIHWMTPDLHQIAQSKRVSVGLDGKLYFSHVTYTDSKIEYCCVAVYSKIRHMAQRTPVTLNIARGDSIKNRAPKILTTQGGMDKPITALKGEVLMLECIAEGLPSPTIEWKKEEDNSLRHHVVFESYGKVLKITNVTEKDHGIYHCAARNELGSDQRSFHVLVEAHPRWDKQLESSIQGVGSEVILNCSASGKPEPEIRWLRNGIPLTRETLPQNHQMKESLIFIHSLQQSDSAVYQCEATNKHGTIFSSANINVLDIPPLVLTTDNRTYTTVLGHNISLFCDTFAVPLADVIWYHGKTIIHPEGGRYRIDKNGTLHIQEAEPQDVGSYICKVSNTKGNTAIMAHLTLREPTRGYVSPENPWAKRWHSMTLTCHISCDSHLCSSLKITWMKDGRKLRENKQRLHVRKNILSIYNVTWEDGGTYYCIGNTSLDSMIAETQLAVRDVPMPPEDLHFSEEQDRSVMLSWAAGDSHNSPISEFIIQSIKDNKEPREWEELTRVSGNVTKVLLQLNPYFNYQFRVFAVNGIGKSSPSLHSKIYSTPPAAPDYNPLSVHGEAIRPDEMTVRWEPLSLDDHNGPGLEYSVSWRLHGVETEWHHKKVKHPQFTIKNTPAYVPYDIHVQAVNDMGSGPEPELQMMYSGEDTPDATPSYVSVDLVNHSIANVTWTEISQDRVRGHLSGYKIIYWKVKNLDNEKMHHTQRHVLSFPGRRNWGIIPKLHPFSHYQVSVVAYNTRGDGPKSSPVTFQTPEGVPEQPQLLQIESSDMDSFTLSWAPPKRINGILTSYILQHQIINEGNVSGIVSNITITNPDAVSHKVPRLEVGTKYKFYLQACTRMGCSKPVSEEGLALSLPTYTNASQGLSTQGWFIGLMCAVALLTLLMLTACFVQRNKGGKYAVKEKEELHPEAEVHSVKDQPFFDDSSYKKAINGSMDSLSLDIKTYDSVDSLVQYSDGEHSHFNEDGSFIGAYTESKEKHPEEENVKVQSLHS
ncbi:neural cell adhesion molecule L1-like protein isoform X2 [Pseudophryne corroboree]|uniref:neural cell adhesion molecule L1-like protein isoform X2 n=1 Tax=Pseudophryne corroboree TaxID=495146 RepID=UPI003081565B